MVGQCIYKLFKSSLGYLKQGFLHSCVYDGRIRVYRSMSEWLAKKESLLNSVNNFICALEIQPSMKAFVAIMVG